MLGPDVGPVYSFSLNFPTEELAKRFVTRSSRQYEVACLRVDLNVHVVVLEKYLTSVIVAAQRLGGVTTQSI